MILALLFVVLVAAVAVVAAVLVATLREPDPAMVPLTVRSQSRRHLRRR